MDSSWWELAGLLFFSFMVVTVALLWALAIKAGYNEEKQKKEEKQQQ